MTGLGLVGLGEGLNADRAGEGANGLFDLG